MWGANELEISKLLSLFMNIHRWSMEKSMFNVISLSVFHFKDLTRVIDRKLRASFAVPVSILETLWSSTCIKETNVSKYASPLCFVLLKKLPTENDAVALLGCDKNTWGKCCSVGIILLTVPKDVSRRFLLLLPNACEQCLLTDAQIDCIKSWVTKLEYKDYIRHRSFDGTDCPTIEPYLFIPAWVIQKFQNLVPQYKVGISVAGHFVAINQLHKRESYLTKKNIRRTYGICTGFKQVYGVR